MPEIGLEAKKGRLRFMSGFLPAYRAFCRAFCLERTEVPEREEAEKILPQEGIREGRRRRKALARQARDEALGRRAGGGGKKDSMPNSTEASRGGFFFFSSVGGKSVPGRKLAFL